METNNFNELLYSLPDYITGELNDDDIKEKIEARLLTDSSFREEYDSLKSTMNFLTQSELESPSEVYFANLQANILSRVHAKKEKRVESLLVKLAGYWKVFVPALTVCVVLVIYSRNINDTQIPMRVDKVQLPLNEITGTRNKPQDTSAFDEAAATDKTEHIDMNQVAADESDATFPIHKKSAVFGLSKANLTEDTPSSANDEIEGSLIFSREDDVQAQDEYDNLSTDDQLDILQSLKDKKL